MGGRYFITGVQIGMIRAFAKLENDVDINHLLDDIEKVQYLGEKEKVEKDLKKIQKKK